MNRVLPPLRRTAADAERFGRNEPVFDPLNASPEEEDDMLAGYWAASDREAILPSLASVAFEHGWRMRRNDRAGVVDEDQRELCRRAAVAERTR